MITVPVKDTSANSSKCQRRKQRLDSPQIQHIFHYKTCLSTYRIVDEAVTFVVNEDESGSGGIRVDFAHTNHMAKLVDEIPILDEEIVNSAALEKDSKVMFLEV